jgi:hypothetical protein
MVDYPWFDWPFVSVSLGGVSVLGWPRSSLVRWGRYHASSCVMVV